MRPYVYCELYFKDNFYLEFALVNTGITPAINIKINLKEPLYSLINGEKQEIPFIKTLRLASDDERSTLIGTIEDFKKEHPIEQITYDVSYESIFGKHERKD